MPLGVASPGDSTPVFIHHGSAESKDSDERIEAIVKWIEKRLEERAS